MVSAAWALNQNLGTPSPTGTLVGSTGQPPCSPKGMLNAVGSDSASVGLLGRDERSESDEFLDGNVPVHQELLPITQRAFRDCRKPWWNTIFVAILPATNRA